MEIFEEADEAQIEHGMDINNPTPKAGLKEIETNFEPPTERGSCSQCSIFWLHKYTIAW